MTVKATFNDNHDMIKMSQAFKIVKAAFYLSKTAFFPTAVERGAEITLKGDHSKCLNFVIISIN